MRLCTIMSGGKAAVGVKMGDGKIVDLSKQMPRGPKSVSYTHLTLPTILRV